MPLALKNYILTSAIVFLALAAFPSVFAASTTKITNGGFNQPGNILITDQFNNRVIEIDRAGNIVWQFGNGPGDTSANAIAGTNDAERVGSLTLMSGTGVPPGATTNCKAGCVDNRVLLVDQGGNIVWQYGQNGVGGIGPNQLNNPNAAELLPNGHILISDENNNRAIEVTHTTPSRIIAAYTAHGTVSGVAFASRLANGHTLLTDSNNGRIVEVDARDNPVWEYFTNTRPGSNPSPLPTRAVRLANGNTLISDQFNDQVIEVTRAKVIVATYGTINDPGFSPSTTGEMNAPYSAYVIGDYTGITPPFGF